MAMQVMQEPVVGYHWGGRGKGGGGGGEEEEEEDGEELHFCVSVGREVWWWVWCLQDGNGGGTR